MAASIDGAACVIDALLIDRSDIRRITVARRALPELAPGCVRLAVRNAALTANNITYAASGDALRYWEFFPSGVSGKGIAPVWGYADVVASTCPEVAVGTVAYGFLPMAQALDVRPTRVCDTGFVDGESHRQELAQIYNAYRFVDQRLAGLPPDMRSRYALLQPLLATAVLLDDFLAGHDWFGARTLLMTSASSKTAIGLATLVSRREKRPELVGLTSAANAGFVRALGCHDRLVTYEAMPAELGTTPSMLVDFAGNRALREVVHRHYADAGSALVHSCAVGTSHWDRFDARARLSPPKPVFFFAPAQAEKRSREWGASRLSELLFERWQMLALESRGWLDIVEVDGMAAVPAVWQRLCDGKVSPREGVILTLH